MTQPDSPSTPEAEFDFAPFGFHKPSAGKTIDIVPFLFTMWKPMAIGLCLGTILGIGAYLYLGPVYSATTQVLVSKKASVPINDGEANRYGDRGDHVELIKTDLIVERAFENHGLNDIPALAGAYDPLKEVTEGLQVTRNAGQESSFDNLLEIEYLHPDKNIARVVAQAVVEAYRDYLSETRDENAEQIQKLLIDRNTNLTNEIRELEASYQKFRREAPVFLKASPIVTANGMPAQPQSRYEAELASIEQAQNENLRKRAGIQAKLATLDRMITNDTSREVLEFWVLHSLSTGPAGQGKGGGGSSSALSGPPAKGQLDQQLLTARVIEQKLLNVLGENHSSIRTIRKEIDTILDFYRRQGLTPPALDRPTSGPLSSRSASLGMDLVSVYRHTMEEQLEELTLDDEKLEILHADAEQKAKQAELFEIEDQHRKDHIALKKEQVKGIFDQIAAYDVAKEQEGYRLKQISQVRVERSLKRVIKIVGACSIMCCALVFCLGYFREWTDTSMKTLDELRVGTAAQILGTVPQFVSSLDADRLARETGLAAELCYFHRPGSREAESYRALRTTLLFAMGDGEQIVQVSSSEPGDGKSTTTANLSVAMARSGKSVLLIDGDLRRPRQHAMFGLPQEIGLTEVLLGELEWINAVRETGVDGLSVMTAGLSPDNPSELLAKSALPGILGEARDHYDLIVIDSPPILAVSDPSVLSPHTDGMLLVVRMNKNRRPTIMRTRETLRAHGVRLYGVVANGFDAAAAEGAGYHYDEYRSYYSESESTPTGSNPPQIPRESVPNQA